MVEKDYFSDTEYLSVYHLGNICIDEKQCNNIIQALKFRDYLISIYNQQKVPGELFFMWRQNLIIWTGTLLEAIITEALFRYCAILDVAKRKLTQARQEKSQLKQVLDDSQNQKFEQMIKLCQKYGLIDDANSLHNVRKLRNKIHLHAQKDIVQKVWDIHNDKATQEAVICLKKICDQLYKNMIQKEKEFIN